MKYTVTVEAVRPVDMLHPTDVEESPVGEHHIDAESEEKALDAFHDTVPIKVLDDFKITVKSEEEVSFEVTVEKTMYCSGSVTIKAHSSDEAIEKTEAQINSGQLQTTDVLWGDLIYEDNSFGTTGDVD